ncbi:DUF3857 domain-containing protein [Bernardetia sp. OM2101]|uniref:DUF3857 domain-containing protein n=1 Tax=Bernardetia sp. OM2101 TaxID=3344876 RepID=UPI0035CFF119
MKIIFKKTFLSILLLVFSFNFLIAQNYSVSSIPDSLKGDNAHVVVRKSDTKIEVVSLTKVNYSQTWAYTILDVKANKYFSRLIAYYDDFSKITKIEGALYDAMGNQIERLKKSDITDWSPDDGMSIAHDNRAKFAEFHPTTYPYTVEFTIEKSYTATFFVPDWHPQISNDVAVQNASFSLTSSVPLRIKQINIPNQADNIEKVQTKNWNLKNITAKRKEPFSPDWELQSPNVYVAPTQFEIDGYTGSLNTWEDFGKWGVLLNKDRQTIPEELANQLNELVADAPNDYEKIRRIYKYLQDNTRYVSIQLGIGGWQPFPAEEVAEKKYGDCKALSNFTHAMLKSVGIDSHYAFIRAGSYAPKMMKDFPSNQFNHAILCVPLKEKTTQTQNKQDTLWLECTSQTEAFAYQGGFTEDRDALLITPEGGKVVHTTIYTAEDNRIARKANIILAENGSANAEVRTEYGALQERSRKFLVEEGKDEQIKFLYKSIPLNNVEIKESEMIRHKQRIPFVEEKMTLEIKNCAKRTGKRLFIQPNLFTQEETVPEIYGERTQPLILSLDWIDTDTIEFVLPEGFAPEAVPEEENIESQFGSYSTKYIMSEKGLTYIRKMQMKKGEFAKESYAEFVEFLEKVQKADKAKLVLVNRT